MGNDTLIMGFILSFIAHILFTLVYLLDGIIILFVGVRGRKYYELVSKRKFDKAFKTDVLANFLFPTTWTFFFSHYGGYKFGRFGETLSSAIGRKSQDNSLGWFGYVFYYILYGVDYTKWKLGGHCVANIMSEEEIENFIKK